MTSLVGGTRVKKSSERLEAYGQVDELNSFIGILAMKVINESDKAFLTKIQRDLFSLGGYLATEDEKKLYIDINIFSSLTVELEKRIDSMSAVLTPLRSFVLPGGCEAACFSHVCRTVCRRVERSIFRLADTGVERDAGVTAYINRLNDYFFVLSRKINFDMNTEEVLL